MDETRKRYLLAGVLVGTVTVGLVVLARKTPPDLWPSTLRRVAGDVLDLIQSRYGGGDSPTVEIAENALEQIEESSDETALSRAFHEAVEEAQEESR